MNTKLKFDILNRLPNWITRWFPVKVTIKVAPDKTQELKVKHYMASSWDFYINDRVEVYSYSHKGEFVFADLLLHDTRNKGRIFAIAYQMQTVFVDPSDASIAFLDSPWKDATTTKVYDLKWVKIDPEDIDTLGIDKSRFIKLSFEDFISENPLLTESNLAFLFLKYN